jgi:hypothetical protein
VKTKMTEEKEKQLYLPQVRISQEVYSWLQNKAVSERRSMTQQLIWELERMAAKEGE